MSEILVNRIKEEAKRKKDMSLKDLGTALKLGENAIYTWKKSNPSIDKLQKVADYLDVSTDYLLGRTDKKRYYDLTEKDKRDIGEEVDLALAGVMGGGDVNFYGEPVSDEDLKKIRDAMIIAYELSRKEAKKKFTRKDLRD